MINFRIFKIYHTLENTPFSRNFFKIENSRNIRRGRRFREERIFRADTVLPSDPASESPEESKSEDETLEIQMFKDNQEPKKSEISRQEEKLIV